MDEKDFTVTRERAVHMVGDYVAVCARTTEIQEKVVVKGVNYFSTVDIVDLSKGVYIDFVSLRQDRNGEWYEDDDIPVAGGLDIEIALKVAAELTKAAQYINGAEA